MNYEFKHGIDSILKEFEIELEDESQYDDFLNKLNKFYQNDNRRHYYHEITGYADKAESKAMEILSNNIRYILETKECCKNIYKLADHLSMELIRKQQINDFKTTTEKYEQTIDSLKSKTEEYDTIIKDFKITKKDYNDIKNNINKLKRKQKNITRDFIVILGIFAAIFMAFDSGLKIELEILSQVNDYAKGVLIIFIALFTYILLKSFYRFIVYIYSNNHDKFSVKQHTWKYCLKALAKPLNCALVALVALYCYLVHRIDEQYKQKIKPIVKEEISKLQQKEEKGNIIIYNNTSSTQNQDSTIIPKNEHTQQPMKIKANPQKQNTKKQSDNTKQACPPCQN